MFTTDIERIKQNLENVLTVIDPNYVETLTNLHKRFLKEHIEWAIGGELGEALRAVPVTPDCIEIITTKKGAAQIFLAVEELNPKGIFFQTQKLPRNAIVAGKECPVYTRSYFFEFTLNTIKIKVHGDLQYRISDWEWGDKLEFVPEDVYIVGLRTAVVPLQLKYEIYQQLGWADRAEKIDRVLSRRTALMNR